MPYDTYKILQVLKFCKKIITTFYNFLCREIPIQDCFGAELFKLLTDSVLPTGCLFAGQKVKSPRYSPGLGVTSVPFQAVAQFEGDLGEILALVAKILPYIGLREKWESPKKKKKKKKFFFLRFLLVSTL